MTERDDPKDDRPKAAGDPKAKPTGTGGPDAHGSGAQGRRPTKAQKRDGARKGSVGYTFEEFLAFKARQEALIKTLDDPKVVKRIANELRTMPKMLGGAKWFQGRRGPLSRKQVQHPRLQAIVSEALATGAFENRPICTKALVYRTHRDPVNRPLADKYEDWDWTEDAIEVVQQPGLGRTFVADATGAVREYPYQAVTAAVGAWLVDRGRLPRELLPKLTKVRMVKKKAEPETREPPMPGPRSAPRSGERHADEK